MIEPSRPGRSLSMDGLTVHRRGPRGAPRVVLVHGAMDRAGGFVKLLRRLAHLDVIRYDRRGYGSSRPARPHPSLAGHVDDLLTVVNDEPAVVVGHSFGGLVALAAAARRPDLIPSVAAFEAPLPWCETSADSAAKRFRDWVERSEHDPGDAAEQFLRRMLGDRTWERLPPVMRHDRRAEGPALVADLVAARRSDAVVELASLAVPVLAGCGDRSSVRHRVAAQTLADGVSRGELTVIAGAAHPAHYTHPAAFADFVERAVDRVPRPGSGLAGVG
jgi:pimeloyl-ACP methyl ester carboxylesterase